MTSSNRNLLFKKNISHLTKGDIPYKITDGFRSWLTAKKYSNSTIRNYLTDVNRYFEFIKTSPSSNPTIYNPDIISSYLQTISTDSNYRRYLSSLSKFFQFTIDQNLSKINPLKQAQKIKKPTINEILNNYQSYLIKKGFSQSTIRNYINDIQQFINFSQTNPSEPH